MAENHEDLEKNNENVVLVQQDQTVAPQKVFKTKLSHKQLKAARKKERRKIKRQQDAQERDEELAEAEGYVDSQNDQLRSLQEEAREKREEERRERERTLHHTLWLERERHALEAIAERKRKEEMQRKRLEEEEKQIRAEWDERQRKEKEDYEKKKEVDKAKREKQDALLKEAQSGGKGKDGGSWHNPLAPATYGQEADVCPFFAKTGACRFGEQCSRAHPVPESSCTLLFKGMYAHFGLMEGLQEEFDLDITLEYEDRETYQHFRDFYEDVLPEFKSIGKIAQFKVCCNYEPHLRGNVYIQFRREEDAQQAFMLFNARWYGGRQLQCEFCSVTRWKNAICGQFRTKKCPKGKNCNFLHVFQNPGGEFWEADRDLGSADQRSDRRQHWQNSDRGYRGNRDNRRGNWDRQGSIRRSRSRSRSPCRSSRRRSRSPRSTRRSRSNSPKRSVRRSRSRSRSPSRSSYRQKSRSPKRKSNSRYRSRSRSRSPRSSVRSIRQQSTRRSRSPSQNTDRSKMSERRRKTRSPSPTPTAHRNSNAWNSDSDNDEHYNTRGQSRAKTLSSPTPNGAKDSPTSLNSHRSKSRSPSWSSSGKHKHKKHKKEKKHKQSRHKKDTNGGEQDTSVKASLAVDCKNKTEEPTGNDSHNNPGSSSNVTVSNNQSEIS